MAAPNDEGPALATPAPQNTTNTNSAIVAQHDAERKAFTTLRATAAERGMGLYRIQGGFLLAWGSTFRELRTLDEVGALLLRLGVR